MNRRSFFKTVTGFVAGIYVAFAPGMESKADVDKIINETLSNDPNWKNTKTRIISGKWVSDGKAIIVHLPFEPDCIELYDCDINEKYVLFEGIKPSVITSKPEGFLVSKNIQVDGHEYFYTAYNVKISKEGTLVKA